MTYVITETCSGMRAGGCDGKCRDVCPVDGIQKGVVVTAGRLAAQLYIDPTACIECGRCTEVCTAGAIVLEEALPDTRHAAARINAEFFRTGLPVDG